jgi:hypothetical protein
LKRCVGAVRSLIVFSLPPSKLEFREAARLHDLPEIVFLRGAGLSMGRHLRHVGLLSARFERFTDRAGSADAEAYRFLT